MITSVNNKKTMTLYIKKFCLYCHCVRIVLSEKGLNANLIEINNSNNSKLLQLNPYGAIPTLVDRDLVLYETSVIMEYLEERFPHPPLMPVYPVSRGRNRLMMIRIDRDWYSLANKILHIHSSKEEKKIARECLIDSLLSITSVFSDSPFFLSEDFTLVDCSIASLLWHFPLLGIHRFKNKGKEIFDYADRIFSRTSFKNTLIESDQEIIEIFEENTIK